MSNKFAFPLLVLIGLAAVKVSADTERSTDNGQTFTTTSPDIAASATRSAEADAGHAKHRRRGFHGFHGPVIFTFDRAPKAPWQPITCSETGSATASHGILTIDSPTDCYELSLVHPDGIWHRHVSNSRGWVIEASLRVDPVTQPECSDRGAVQIWAHDHTNLLIIGFSTNEICLAYPDNVRYAMDTSSFHVYRIESRGNRVRIYVDGELKINHVLTTPGGGSDILSFGDGTGGSRSLSQWDYFSYDVFPRLKHWDDD